MLPQTGPRAARASAPRADREPKLARVRGLRRLQASPVSDIARASALPLRHTVRNAPCRVSGQTPARHPPASV